MADLQASRRQMASLRSAASAVPFRETQSGAPAAAAAREDEQLVDGWPTWLLDNVPREALEGIVPRSADAYDKIEKVGQGTYSNVYKARERGTGRVVALKKVRLDTSESESVRFMAREIRVLQRLDHPNVIRLEGIATSRMHRSIYLVFDFMYSDLTKLIARPGHRLTEPQIKCYMQQLLAGLQHCHERGILHRDIKGSNLLIDRHGVLKIGDFGLANYYGPGRRRPLTSRVVTLWYRAPELLLGSTDYGVGIDLWSAGCLLAEMFFGKPLLRATTEVEQLFKIFTLCGSPPDDYWRKLKLSPTFKPPKAYKPTTGERFRDLPPSAVGLLATLLALDPAARGTAGQALQSSFFSTPPLPCDLSELPVVYKEEVADPAASKPKVRQRSQRRKDSKLKTEEQRSGINTESPNKEEDKVIDRANSGQESDGAANAAANASSRVQEPLDVTINVATYSYSTVPGRFSVSPDQVLLPQEASPAAPQDQQQLPAAKASHRSGSDDDHENRKQIRALDDDNDAADGAGEPPSGSGNEGVALNGSQESRSAAFMTDFEAAAAVLRGSEEIPSKQYVIVD
ncbi:LOW QUALITY PROTEIN: probable serine/threonine-protein kinase At1g54610 [Setaria italica]|nr:LOW QUALITY PROTEIN: probable serine/threonine-protein kinase At1g54610 [Setaria italica]